jgi:hypothetical protein
VGQLEPLRRHRCPPAGRVCSVGRPPRSRTPASRSMVMRILPTVRFGSVDLATVQVLTKIQADNRAGTHRRP